MGRASLALAAVHDQRRSLSRFEEIYAELTASTAAARGPRQKIYR
jgi:hypothetical protein